MSEADFGHNPEFQQFSDSINARLSHLFPNRQFASNFPCELMIDQEIEGKVMGDEGPLDIRVSEVYQDSEIGVLHRYRIVPQDGPSYEFHPYNKRITIIGESDSLEGDAKLEAESKILRWLDELINSPDEEKT